jgi:hypothetical protein
MSLASYSRLAKRQTAPHVLRRDLRQLEAGLIIALAPGCPRWASSRVDRITLELTGDAISDSREAL